MSYEDVIEYSCIGKTGNDNECEDIIVQGEHFYAVIDGVTSKYPVTYGGKSAGRYCAELLQNAILSLDKNAECLTALEALSNDVKKAYGEDDITNENKMQACVIIYSKQRREVWCYGDCGLMINGRAFDHSKIIDKLMENLRAFTVSVYLAEGGDENTLYENDIGRESILPFLKKQAIFANKDHYFGYGVIDGTEINEKFAKVYKVNKGDRIILASDGYPKLFPTLKETEKYLEAVLINDPLSINENKQTKMKKRENLSFDDRAYFSFTVG